MSCFSVKSEYCALIQAIANVWWFCYLLRELGIPLHLSLLLLYDNQSALHMAINPCFMLILDILILIYILIMSWLLIGLFDFNMFLPYLNLSIYLPKDYLVNVLSLCIINCNSVSYHCNCRRVLNNMFIYCLFLLL